MKKIVALLIAILFLIPEISWAVRFPASFTDESGTTLNFQRPPRRIISTMPSNTEILFALGLGRYIVGVSDKCNYPQEAKKKPKVGGTILNAEKIVSLKPDLIVMLGDAQRREIKKLRKLNLPVFVINPHSISGVMRSIITLGKVTYTDHPALALASKMKVRIDKAAYKTKRRAKKGIAKPKVFVAVWNKPLISASSGTFIDDLIGIAGGINIASRVRGPYPRYSLEKLTEENPDGLIIAKQNIKSPSEIYNDPRWKGLKAVRNKKVLLIDADLISRPGPRIIDGLEKISEFFEILKKPWQ